QCSRRILIRVVDPAMRALTYHECKANGAVFDGYHSVSDGASRCNIWGVCAPFEQQNLRTGCILYVRVPVCTNRTEVADSRMEFFDRGLRGRKRKKERWRAAGPLPRSCNLSGHVNGPGPGKLQLLANRA
ncbi:hypothetical protein BaRGS_00021933, partial [Batillaria attramentaria]